MRTWLKKKLNNDGNTFIVIMVTLACMSILVAAILMSVSYWIREQKLNMNNKSNFYYLEQAMDEIYQGVGSDSIGALTQAYTDTVSVMIYFDGNNYVSLDTAAANNIMKQKFMQALASDVQYKSQAELYNHLKSFISEADVELIDPSTASASTPKLYLEVVTTEVAAPTMSDPHATKTVYEKLIIHNVSVKRTTPDGYIQSITTDIEITEPEFQVSFDGTGNKNSALYEFALIGDMGVEFDNAASGNDSVSVTGNVYAASDYYNKKYDETGVSVTSYNSSKLNDCNGILDQSKYSGLYFNDSNVSIMADKVIVPGSISVINDAKVSILGNVANNPANRGRAEIWADNLVLAPASTRTVGLLTDGGSLNMKGNVYVSDDLEVNNDDAEVAIDGNYYGYNYSQTTDLVRVLSEYAKQATVGSTTVTHRDHYNSSAIVVNGDNAKLDFSGVDNLYVAGRAYIQTTSEKNAVTGTDSSGNQTSTVTYTTVEGNSDVQTGESISVKSNQVAYVPQGINTAGQPIFTSVEAVNQQIVNHMIDQGWVDSDNMVISQALNGKTYYFVNFKSSTASVAFFEWYANDVKNLPGADACSDLASVVANTDFTVNEIILNSDATATVTTTGAYTAGALNVAQNKNLTVSGASTGIFGTGATVTNFNATASNYNKSYMEMKYTFDTIDPDLYTGDAKTSMQTLKDDIAALDGAEVCPLNYYLDFTKITDSTNVKAAKVGSYYVWITGKDVEVKAPASTGGKVMGLIISKGDVTFDDNVTRFEGLVISGSKIKINHKMDFIANPEIIKTILRTAETSEGTSEDYAFICDLFKFYEKTLSTGTDPEDSGKSIATIQVGDVLGYENWKKNVE